MKTETIEQELEILKEEIVNLRNEFYNLRNILFPSNQEISLEKMRKAVKIDGMKICMKCKGRGSVCKRDYCDRTMNDCPDCNGKGFK